MSRLRFSAFFLAITACSFGGGPAITVDDVEISAETLGSLHEDVDALSDDELAGSALLLILQESLSARATSELGIVPDEADVTAAYNERLEAMEGRGVDAVLAARNQSLARIQIESELDVIRDSVGAQLVRTQAGNFDLAEAYEEYSLENAEVCIRQMTLAAVEDFEAASGRLAFGEPFGDVAREISIDPFVDRTEGVGAGGELGCSAPNALPEGLGVATLTAAIDEVTGPVVSSAGLHLLVVYERTASPLEEVTDDVLDHAVPLQGPDLFREWAVGVLVDIDVTVNKRYGTWGVLPETDPSPTVVPRNRTDSIISR